MRKYLVFILLMGLCSLALAENVMRFPTGTRTSVLNQTEGDARYYTEAEIDALLDEKLNLDQTSAQTLTASPIFDGFTNYSVPFFYSGVLTQDNARFNWNDASDTLYAYIFTTTGLTVTGWTEHWALFADASSRMVGEDEYTYNAGTNTLDVDNIIADVATISDVVIPTIFDDMSEPTGFENRTDSALSFVGGATPTFTITGTDFGVYFDGVKVLKDTESIEISDDTGIHWIYYDKDTQVLSESTTLVPFNHPYIATVYWNTTTDLGLLGGERHNIVMDWHTHTLLHLTVGTRYESGLTGTFDDTTLSITSGVIDDEDISHAIGAQTTADVLYKNGTVEFEWDLAQTTYFKEVGGTLQYNDGNDLANVTNNKYIAMWIFATNDTTTPITALMGQRQDNILAQARENNKFENLTLGTLPFQEMKILYRVILRNQAGTTTWIENQDLRSVSNLPAGTFLATLHSTLTDLGWALSGHNDLNFNVDRNNDDRVGIGTTAPSTNLDLASGDMITAGTITADQFTDGTATITGGNISSTGDITISPTNRLIVDGNSTTECLRLLGADAANEIFDIHVDSDGTVVMDLTASDDNYSFLDIRTESTTQGILIRASDGTAPNTYANLYVTDAADDVLSIVVNSAVDGDALNITASDRVGIGTTEPNEQLELTANLRLPASTATTGIYYVGADTFIHNYGTENTFLGEVAGNLTLSGGFNTGVGFHALDALTTGAYHTGIGEHALGSTTGGAGSVAVGFQALFDHTVGSYNVAVGELTLGNLAGDYHRNTAIGRRAGFTLTSGGNCVFLGNEAGYYETAGNKLFIDNVLRANEADGRAKALIYGVFAAAVTDQDLRINADVGINAIPTALLDVGGGVATTIDGDGDLLVADDAEIDGNLYVDTDAIITGTLTTGDGGNTATIGNNGDLTFSSTTAGLYVATEHFAFRSAQFPTVGIDFSASGGIRMKDVSENVIAAFAAGGALIALNDYTLIGGSPTEPNVSGTLDSLVSFKASSNETGARRAGMFVSEYTGTGTVKTGIKVGLNSFAYTTDADVGDGGNDGYTLNLETGAGGLVGGRYASRMAGDGNIKMGGGVASRAQIMDTGTGIYDDAYAFLAEGNDINTIGTMTSAYGLWVKDGDAGSGTIGTQYGIKIEDQTAGDTDYAIFTGTGEISFGDNVGIGLTNPQVALNVAGEALFTGTVTIDSDVYGLVLGDGQDASITWDNANSQVLTTGDHRVSGDFYIGNYAHGNPALVMTGDHNSGQLNWIEADNYFDFANLMQATHYSMSLEQGSIQSMSDDGAIAVTNSYLRVVGNLGAVTLDADPAIANGTTGQVIIIEGTSDANTVTIVDNVNTQLAAGAAVVLGLNDTIMLIYNGTDWIEISRSLN